MVSVVSCWSQQESWCIGGHSYGDCGDNGGDDNDGDDDNAGDDGRDGGDAAMKVVVPARQRPTGRVLRGSTMKKPTHN